jgi:glycosyltransferase involved in cell wall biosynthesis
MKLLFISARDVNKKSHGGFQCTNRNYLSFCELIGSNNVEVIDITYGLKKSLFHRIIKWINYLNGFREGLSHKKINKIISISKETNYVFIDSSQFGIIAYYLKKAKYKGKVICFFHNVEYNIARQYVEIKSLSFWRLFMMHYNEKSAIKYSDRIVVLNMRDQMDLQKIYGAYKANIIPISLLDTFKDHGKELTSTPPTLIFIGNKWYPNIHGLKWFVNNVLNDVNVKLQIVGIGMDELKDQFVHPKIEFLGFVPNLSSVLINADYVLSPIFIGGGMKVKTCESLMYGKNIIGTKEAFEGYEVDYQKVGAMCNNKEEFIDTINHYCSVKREKFNEYSRKCFLEKYSFQATLKRFDDLLSK